ncbi:uncharacterized protein AB675_5849 [Cyphellophora attinorum]|uniref:Clr5 domain-containing protein n=1 Tax=Cyphellophora attinorum TaxID=1664694 RepID=A0A0N0NLC0_9EURO|nr:uncharacterized protein AB675_5849 [Phialophora attinorum]KPI38869.1 hypothetical protein AB675_5849 [Phialophora attinorum]
MGELVIRAPSKARSQLRDSPSKAEWTWIRPVFERLYVQQGQTLTDVMQQLREDHNFHATQQMYKRRIKAWGLGKNLKGTDVQYILDMAASREARGKGTHEVLLRGRNVSMDAVFKSQQRRKAPMPMDVVDARSSVTNKYHRHIRALTPPPGFDRIAWASPDKDYEDTLRRFGGFYSGLIDGGYYTVRSGQVVSPRTLVNAELSDVFAALFILKPGSNMLVIRKLALMLQSITRAVDVVTSSWLIHAVQVIRDAGHASIVATLLLHLRQLARYIGHSQSRINFLQNGDLDASRSQQLVADGVSVRVALEQSYGLKADTASANLNLHTYSWFWRQRGYPSHASVDEIPATAPRTLSVLDQQHRFSGLFAFGTLVLLRLAIQTDRDNPMIQHLTGYLAGTEKLSCDDEQLPNFYFDSHWLSRQSAAELAAIYCQLGLHDTEQWLLCKLISSSERSERWQEKGQYSLLVCAANCPKIQLSPRGLDLLRRKQELEDSWRVEIEKAALTSELFSSPARPAVVVP